MHRTPFGLTVPQRGSFYGLPWLMGEIGAPSVAGPTISQACSTGVRVLQSATAEIREGNATTCLAIAADRTSNGPHLYYPAPDAKGGTGEHENWILDNFNRDPYAGIAMIQTASGTFRFCRSILQMEKLLTVFVSTRIILS